MNTASLKIALVEIDGEKRVPPIVMDLLLRIAEHRDICDDCGKAWKTGDGRLICATGAEMHRELMEQPEVTLEKTD